MLRDGGNACSPPGPPTSWPPSRRRSTRSGDRVAQLPPTSATSSSAGPWPQLAVERFGAVDGVVQVAAYDGLLAGLDGTSDDDWHAVLGTNVVGSMHVVTAMTERDGRPRRLDRAHRLAELGAAAR